MRRGLEILVRSKNRAAAAVVTAAALAATMSVEKVRMESARECEGFSSSTYPANNPSEDRMIVNGSIAGWTCCAVFDGHGGWNVSEFASKSLLKELSYTSTTVAPDASDEEVDTSIINAFTAIERKYTGIVREAYKLGFGNVASVGSCVLLAQLKNDHLVVANCGDCRAVLGSHHQGLYFHSRLTREHNCRAELEALHLRAEHPGESNIIYCKHPHACYVKGKLQLTRALGDFYLKSDEFNAPPEEHRSRGRHVAPPFTPPYVNFVPDITHIRLDRRCDKFLILATDGLWDFVSDEEAVKLVGSLQNEPLHKREQLAASMLVDLALEKAARSCKLSIDELKSISQGSKRRSRHDDTTVVVMYF